MLQIHHQMLFTDKLYSYFEVFLVKKLAAARVMHEFNYEHNFVPKMFHFYEKVFKFKQPVKSYLKILWHFYVKRYCGKSEITKKTQNDMILAV